MVMTLKDAVTSGTIKLPQDVIDKINAAEDAIVAAKAAKAADATQAASKSAADQAVAQNQADQAGASQAHTVANNLGAVALEALKSELGLS